MPNSFVYEILFVYILYILFVYNSYLNPLEGRVRVWDHKQQVLKEITDHVDKIKVSESMKKEKGVICECIDVTKKKCFSAQRGKTLCFKKCLVTKRAD